jgi:surface protein
MKPTIQPKTTQELWQLVRGAILSDGPCVDLNYIDTSLVTDMSHLFEGTHFTGDISRWNTSLVTTMKGMFRFSRFDGDISRWDVSSVADFSFMFLRGKFDGRIDSWKVNPSARITGMFVDCSFRQRLPLTLDNIAVSYVLFGRTELAYLKSRKLLLEFEVQQLENLQLQQLFFNTSLGVDVDIKPITKTAPL